MDNTNTLTDDIKKNKLEEAKHRLMQGEKLPKDLSNFDKSQIFDVLVNNKAFDIINLLVKDKTIETDIYEYEKLESSIFSKLLKRLGNTEADLIFFADFVSRLDNIDDTVGNTTLLGLAFAHSAPIEIIKLLVDNGCTVNYKNNYEENYLYQIIQEYDIKENSGLPYLEFLIQEGVDPNAGNITGQTALHLAIDKNKKQYIECLLQHGADPNQPNKNGETAFYIALAHKVCNLETYSMLTQYAPVNFDLTNKDGQTLFTAAVQMRRSGAENELQLLQALITDGADIYQTAPHYGNEKSALDWICEYRADVLQMVLETGVVEIDRKDEEGNTLLHKVCAYNVNYDMEEARQLYRKVKLLIEQGADVNAVNDRDQSPLDLAGDDNLKHKTVALLLKHKS